jgi:hypothetical protein
MEQGGAVYHDTVRHYKTPAAEDIGHSRRWGYEYS